MSPHQHHTCIYVYVSLYLHIYICIHIYICTYKCTNISTHIYIYVSIYVSVSIYTNYARIRAGLLHTGHGQPPAAPFQVCDRCLLRMLV